MGFAFTGIIVAYIAGIAAGAIAQAPGFQWEAMVVGALGCCVASAFVLAGMDRQ